MKMWAVNFRFHTGNKLLEKVYPGGAWFPVDQLEAAQAYARLKTEEQKMHVFQVDALCL